jgi:hypothetical protein
MFSPLIYMPPAIRLDMKTLPAIGEWTGENAARDGGSKDDLKRMKMVIGTYLLLRVQKVRGWLLNWQLFPSLLSRYSRIEEIPWTYWTK